MDADFRSLREQLARFDTRHRQQELLEWLPRALALGLLLGLGLALLARTRPLLSREELGLTALALAVAVPVLAALVVLTRRRTAFEQARFADHQFNLRERAMAAIEIRDGRLVVNETLAARQLADALDAVRRVDITRQMPLSPAVRDWAPALGLFLVLALAVWLPNPQEDLLREQRAVAAAVAENQATLEALSEDIAADDGLAPEQQAALRRPLEEALELLAQPDLTRSEAVASLSAAEAEMRSLAEGFGNTSLAGSLAGAAAAMSASDAATELGATLGAAQLDQASAAAATLADSLPELDRDARAALAEALAAAAAELQPVDEVLARQLDLAAESLSEGAIAAAQEALRGASGALQRQAQQPAAAEQARSAAETLGQARSEVAQAGEVTSSQVTGTSGEGDQSGSQNGAQAGQAGTGGESQSGLPGAGGPAPGGGHVENVFVPRPADLAGEGENIELDVQCLGDPELCGPAVQQSPSGLDESAAPGSVVPYSEVFGAYRDAAFEALSGSDIPPGLQGIVRDYFSSLEP